MSANELRRQRRDSRRIKSGMVENRSVMSIVADIIIRLLPDAGRFMKPEAVLICSGIIDEREADVLAAVEKNGFAVRDRRESGGWVALACVKKEA